MQRVSRAERLRRQRTGDRGFVYRRPLVSMTALLKETYPMYGTPAKDWPSAATVEVRALVGLRRLHLHRLETLFVRVKSCRSEAEARRRALAKLRVRSGGPLWGAAVASVKPDGVPAVPSIQALTYRVSPLFEMVKREVVDG